MMKQPFCKGGRVIVRLKDHILCGKYRGNGTYWYSWGLVQYVSHKYGYVRVTFEDRYGDERNGFFTLAEGRGSCGYTVDSKNRLKITFKSTTDNHILLPYTKEHKALIDRQQLIDFLVSRSWNQWEYLSDPQLKDLMDLLVGEEVKRRTASDETSLTY